jgi:uncharacterized membrane protein
MLAIVLAFTVSALAYPHLPPRMAIHWNAWGEVNGWASRPVGAWAFPVIVSVIWLILRFLPRFDPRVDSKVLLGTGYDVIVNAVITFLVAIHGALLAYALGWPVPIVPLVQVSLGVLNVVVGTMLPGLPPIGTPAYAPPRRWPVPRPGNAPIASPAARSSSPA